MTTICTKGCPKLQYCLKTQFPAHTRNYLFDLHTRLNLTWNKTQLSADIIVSDPLQQYPPVFDSVADGPPGYYDELACRSPSNRCLHEWFHELPDTPTSKPHNHCNADLRDNWSIGAHKSPLDDNLATIVDLSDCGCCYEEEIDDDEKSHCGKWSCDNPWYHLLCVSLLHRPTSKLAFPRFSINHILI